MVKTDLQVGSSLHNPRVPRPPLANLILLPRVVLHYEPTPPRLYMVNTPPPGPNDPRSAHPLTLPVCLVVSGHLRLEPLPLVNRIRQLGKRVGVLAAWGCSLYGIVRGSCRGGGLRTCKARKKRLEKCARGRGAE